MARAQPAAPTCSSIMGPMHSSSPSNSKETSGNAMWTGAGQEEAPVYSLLGPGCPWTMSLQDFQALMTSQALLPLGAAGPTNRVATSSQQL